MTNLHVPKLNRTHTHTRHIFICTLCYQCIIIYCLLSTSPHSCMCLCKLMAAFSLWWMCKHRMILCGTTGTIETVGYHIRYVFLNKHTVLFCCVLLWLQFGLSGLMWSVYLDINHSDWCTNMALLFCLHNGCNKKIWHSPFRCYQWYQLCVKSCVTYCTCVKTLIPRVHLQPYGEIDPSTLV